MTRDEAISKVRKIRNQARGNDSAPEAATARKLADELMKKHGLKEADLMADSKTLAFEELLAELESYSRSKSLPPAVSEAISMFKKEMSPPEKADALEKIVTVVRIGSLFMGKKHMGPIKEILEATLRKHEIVV